MRRTMSLLTAVIMVGFGSFFSSLRQRFQPVQEITTAPPETTTARPYIRPEGVHAAPDGRGKLVALTFDDGPSAVTGHILDTLLELGGRATFFCLGDRAEQYEGILKRMAAQGCEVASHSHSHERLTRLNSAALCADLERAAAALTEHAGVPPQLLRPPYGSVSERMLNCVDMPVILWSIYSEDWRYCEILCKNRSDERWHSDLLKVANSVLDYVQDGDIVLMHDLYSFTQDLADAVIEELHHQGWQLVTVSELFEAKGAQLEPGVVYRCARW